MSQTGSDVYNELKSEVAKVENEESSVVRALDRSRSERVDLESKREELYLKLAEIYLPALDAESVKSSLVNARAEVKKIFEQRNAERQRISAAMEETAKERKSLTESLSSHTVSLEQIVKQRNETLKQISAHLSKDVDYSQRKNAADQAQAGLNQDKARADAFAQDSERKLPAYQGDELFNYLLNGQEVKPGFLGKVDALIARLTRFSVMEEDIARLIEFQKQRGTYEFLASMPAEIQERIQKQQAVLDLAVQELRKKEIEVEREYKLPEIVANGNSEAKERDRIIAEISQANGTYKELSQKREELSKNRDSGFYVSARNKEVELLKSFSIQMLKSTARVSPDPADDKIVAQIDSIDSELSENESTMSELRKKRTILSDHLTKARRIESTFTSKDFESSRSRFDDSFNIRSLLDGYLSGRYSQSHVESELESNQHFKPRETPSYHSSSYGSSSYRGSSNSDSGGFGGGGFGGGGFSSGGGISSGGFSSGNGF